MNIPTLTKDLAIIQKLSDLPNSTDGLSAAQLKAKFDEAALAIQSWLNNSFIPALKAENLPFTASDQLNVSDVQSAIQLVFEQVRDASSGTITNGSVTKAKLGAELLARVFGGRPWVSLDKPGEEHDPSTEFPVGQLWLRPGFTVSNAAGDSWTATACTVSVGENQVTVTGTSTVAQAEAVMNLPDIGQDGDRIYVLFGIKDKDREITSLTVSLNGGEEESTGDAVHTAALAGGSLSVRFRAVWPSTSLAKGSYTIENLAVVNIDQIMRQMDDCEEMSDWGAYLQSLLPLDSCYSPRELYIQTAAGLWQQVDYETFPVERGGTGVDALKPGEMLVGSGGSAMERLKGAETEHSLLQFADGMPRWRTPKEVADSSGFARGAESTYDGSGAERSVELPGRPVVLWLRFDEQTHLFFQNTSMSGEYSGTVTTESEMPFGTTTSTKKYTAGVTLEGNALKFWRKLPELNENQTWTEGDAVHFNEQGKTYTWTAIY